MSLLSIPRFFAFPVFAFLGQWYWMHHYSPTSIIAGVFWIPVLTYCWFCVGGLSHELIHQNLPLGPRASRLIGQLIGAVILIPYSVYREIHMRHHAYLNTPLDWELWPYSDPKTSLGFRRVFIWFDMMFGNLSTPLIWGRVCFSSATPVDQKTRRTMRREYLFAAFAWSSALGFVFWKLISGAWTFRPEVLIYLLPFILAANCNAVRKIMEHVGLQSCDPLQGTRTIVGKSVVTRLLSYFDFDLAVHGPHHRYPKLQHSMLKTRMGEIQNTHPDTTYPVFQSFTSALFDAFRTVIVNPGVGVNMGCTEDLSHLPGMKDSVPPENGQHISFAQKGMMN